MDIIEHEERLEAVGFKREQVRELIRFVTSGDSQAMTKQDGRRIEDDIKRLEKKIDSDLNVMTHKLIATVWTVSGVSVAAIVGLTKLI